MCVCMLCVCMCCVRLHLLLVEVIRVASPWGKVCVCLCVCVCACVHVCVLCRLLRHLEEGE